ncbi:MAG: hypothetical protein ACYC4D_01360 [Thermoleophilia bacterium]
MNSFLKTTRETKFASAIGGILSRPAAAVVIAGSLSVVTLAASMYLFMFAGRDLLPPPPVAGLLASRILEPVPMNSFPAVAPAIEVPAAAAAPLFLAAAIPAVETAAVPNNTTGTVAGVSMAPSAEDDDDDDRSRGRGEEHWKIKKSESDSSDKSNILKHED